MSTFNRPNPVQRWSLWPQWLATVAIAAWGVLLLNYWLSGRLGLLIHPNYFGITITAGFFLILLAGIRGVYLWYRPAGSKLQHFSLMSPVLLSSILLTGALIGLFSTPRPFTSQTALKRGLQDTTITRARPQAFRTQSNPEERSLLEWITTLDVYPEPDAYTGQKVNIEGFAVHTPDLPETYLTLTRFVITCCATDAYPVGLPVKLDQPRQAYPQDQWFRVQGEMMTESLQGQRRLVIAAKTLDPIPEPQNPYSY